MGFSLLPSRLLNLVVDGMGIWDVNSGTIKWITCLCLILKTKFDPSLRFEVCSQIKHSWKLSLYVEFLDP